MSKSKLREFLLIASILVIGLGLASGLNTLGRRKREAGENGAVANQCFEDEPWPCKTPGYCIALEYICDGNRECPDAYDEDPKVCRAKLRPPKDAVNNVIGKSARYLIPEVLGDVKVARAAHLLTVVSGVDEYSQNARLSAEQTENLRMLVRAVAENDKTVLERLGVPLSAWNDLSWLFDKLLTSGFEA